MLCLRKINETKSYIKKNYYKLKLKRISKKLLFKFLIMLKLEMVFILDMMAGV